MRPKRSTGAFQFLLDDIQSRGFRRRAHAVRSVTADVGSPSQGSGAQVAHPQMEFQQSTSARKDAFQLTWKDWWIEDILPVLRESEGQVGNVRGLGA